MGTTARCPQRTGWLPREAAEAQLIQKGEEEKEVMPKKNVIATLSEGGGKKTLRAKLMRNQDRSHTWEGA